jgi:hypothetical protein
MTWAPPPASFTEGHLHQRHQHQYTTTAIHSPLFASTIYLSHSLSRFTLSGYPLRARCPLPTAPPIPPPPLPR